MVRYLKFIWIFSFIIVFSGCAKHREIPQNERFTLFNKILDVSEEVLGKENVDREKIKKQLMVILNELEPRLKKEVQLGKIYQINNYFFKEKKYEVVPDAAGPTIKTVLDPSSSEMLNLSNLLLGGVLERKRGYCASFVSLYLVVAEYFNLPLFPVILPTHVFVRYDDGKARFNIETTAGGIHIDDKDYPETMGFSSDEISKIYPLTSENSHIILSEIYNNIAVYYLQYKKDYKKAKVYIDKAIVIYKNIEFLLNRGVASYCLKNYNEAKKDYEAVLQKWPLNASALSGMGYIFSNQKDYLKSYNYFKTAYENSGNSAWAGWTFKAYQKIKASLPAFNFTERFEIGGKIVEFHLSPQFFRMKKNLKMLIFWGDEESPLVQYNINSNIFTLPENISKKEFLVILNETLNSQVKGAQFTKISDSKCDWSGLMYSPLVSQRIKVCEKVLVNDKVVIEMTLTSSPLDFEKLFKDFDQIYKSVKIH